jgi:hypothetical protein
MNILRFISSVLNLTACFCLSFVILETSVNPMGLFGQELVAYDFLSVLLHIKSI